MVEDICLNRPMTHTENTKETGTDPVQSVHLVHGHGCQAAREGLALLSACGIQGGACACGASPPVIF